MSGKVKAALVLIPCDEQGRDIESDIQVIDLHSIAIVEHGANENEYRIRTRPFDDSCITPPFPKEGSPSLHPI